MLEIIGFILWAAFWLVLGMIVNHHLMERNRRKRHEFQAFNRRSDRLRLFK